MRIRARVYESGGGGGAGVLGGCIGGAVFGGAVLGGWIEYGEERKDCCLEGVGWGG